MNMNRYLRYISITLVVICIVAISYLLIFCSSNETDTLNIPPLNKTDTPSEIETGTLDIRLLEVSPATVYSEIWIEIPTIQVLKAEGNTDNPDDWYPLIDEPLIIDLVDLRNSATAGSLGEISIPVGDYERVLIDMELIEVYVGENKLDLEVESSPDQLEFSGSLTIKEGEGTIITIEIDIEKSLQLSSEDKIVFEPAIDVDSYENPENLVIPVNPKDIMDGIPWIPVD